NQGRDAQSGGFVIARRHFRSDDDREALVVCARGAFQAAFAVGVPADEVVNGAFDDPVFPFAGTGVFRAFAPCRRGRGDAAARFFFDRAVGAFFGRDDERLFFAGVDGVPGEAGFVRAFDRT